MAQFSLPCVGVLMRCAVCGIYAGCFDHEEEAAKAYDKMMLWCEIHNTAGVKGGITNFESAEYGKELSWLQQCTQVRIRATLHDRWHRKSNSLSSFQSPLDITTVA